MIIHINLQFTLTHIHNCYICLCYPVYRVDREDEMECLITGCNFLLKNIPDEVFMFQRHGNPEYKFHSQDPETAFPYLLVNIGSGVSIVKVRCIAKK